MAVSDRSTRGRNRSLTNLHGKFRYAPAPPSSFLVTRSASTRGATETEVDHDRCRRARFPGRSQPQGSLAGSRLGRTSPRRRSPVGDSSIDGCLEDLCGADGLGCRFPRRRTPNGDGCRWYASHIGAEQQRPVRSCRRPRPSLLTASPSIRSRPPRGGKPSKLVLLLMRLRA
jgi:hypothetical protein